MSLLFKKCLWSALVPCLLSPMTNCGNTLSVPEGPKNYTTVIPPTTASDESHALPTATDLISTPLPSQTTATTSSSLSSPTVESEPTAERQIEPYSLPALSASISNNTQFDGLPFETVGQMPTAIIASTSDCSIVSIDPKTMLAKELWNYTTITSADKLNCDEKNGDSVTDQELESVPGHIEDLDWISPSYVLISMCCEPAAGRFEVLDTNSNIQPKWLALNGRSPSVNHDNVLLYSRPFFLHQGIPAIASVPFQIKYNTSDSANTFYELQDSGIDYPIKFRDNDASNRGSFVSKVDWVGDYNVVFELHRHDEAHSMWLSWIGYIDLAKKSVIVNSRGVGWTLPAGDQLGNLVVIEQECGNWLEKCAPFPASVVVVDSETLNPIYEVAISQSVADLDLVRGWLLLTLTDGRVGTFDLATGTFTAIAEGIRSAVWQE